MKYFFALLLIASVLLCGQALALGSKASVLLRFGQGNALKVISGLHNFDKQNVVDVAWAAQRGGASHIDIACDADLVRAAREVCDLPICVSSVQPADFAAAVNAGADMLELGNFDSFYEKGE